MKNSALEDAIAKYLTLSAFAEAVGVDYQVVQQWRINGVPAKYCKKIEALTGVSPRDLRPSDWNFYWPELKDA
jgi:DNA-binding transcriptional regulator YdaS (Cro superfamily)